MAELSGNFPPGMKASYPTTRPLREGGHRRGGQDPARGDRAGLPGDVPFHGKHPRHADPDHRVPVVLLGTFAVLGLFGFSINMLTMFAMVLAIGLLVDDAIVVVENVERVMAEEGLSPGKPPPNRWIRSPAP